MCPAYKEKKELDVGIFPEDVVKHLQENIKLNEENIQRKSRTIKQLEQEIIIEKEELNQLKYLSEYGDFDVSNKNK